jgi:hypothetical protein
LSEFISFSSESHKNKNAHAFANYCVISNLSKILFNQKFISSLESWEKISNSKINEAAKQLLIQNTIELDKLGKSKVESYLTVINE